MREGPPARYQLWIYPSNGNPPHLADFREFYDGRSRIDIKGSSKRFWKGDIAGNAGLAGDFRFVVTTKALDKHTFNNFRSSWRTMMRFLEESSDLEIPTSIVDLDDIYGNRLLDWLDTKGLGPNHYKRIKSIVDYYFQHKLGRQSLFPPCPAFDDPEVEMVDLPGLQRLNLALRALGRDVKANFREGSILASGGRDPRGVRSSVLKTAAWDERANHAWLVHQLCRNGILSKGEIIAAGGSGLIFGSGATGNDVYGPPNTLPDQGKNSRAGYVGKLRWFYPAKSDTAVFMWLVMILTGFNLASVLEIDISEEDHWWQPSPKGPDRGIVFTRKNRVNFDVFAHSSTNPEFHAYQVIHFMIRRTVGLRLPLKGRLEKLKAEQVHSFTHENVAAIARLEKMVTSPWLFVNLGDAGEIGCFDGDDATFLNTFVRKVADDADLVDDHPSLRTITTRQPRKALFEYTNESSGSFMAQVTGQQSDRRSLRYYLSRRRRRLESFQTATKVIGHTIDGIEKNKIIDETEIKIMLSRGSISEQQRQRLLDFRQRTRLGMGCLDPFKPPKSIAPDHRDGQLCRVQRCTCCILGIVFPESVPSLAHALADLHAIKGTMPYASWTGSSLERESASIEETLKQFNRETVMRHYSARALQIKSKAVVLDGYPSN